ncbi:hypothetical protein GJ496_008253 [Pomphorhynchus laevis]|nr:hypothetical protein GJ496_008253 [Pomphorhynchus laevis]
MFGRRTANDQQLENAVFQLGFTARQLVNQSRKANRQSGIEKDRVKKALSRNNIDGARIYAENSVRKKHEYLNLLKLSARVEGVKSRLQSATAVRSVLRDMSGITRTLEKAMSSMELEKVSQVMDKFEQQFEDVDVKEGVMEGAINQVSTLSTPIDEVTALMRQVADENNLVIADKLQNMPAVSDVNATGVAKRTIEDERDLAARLANLRQ